MCYLESGLRPHSGEMCIDIIDISFYDTRCGIVAVYASSVWLVVWIVLHPVSESPFILLLLFGVLFSLIFV